MGVLQAPALAAPLGMIPPEVEFAQVVNVCGSHWIAISTVGCKPSPIKIYDSLLAGGVSRHTQKLIADLMQCKSKAITIEYEDVQEQKGSNDCGLFAIAFITSI